MTGYSAFGWYRLFLIFAWWYFRQEEPEDIYYSDFYGYVTSESEGLEEAIFDNYDNKFFDNTFRDILGIFVEENIEHILVDILI